MSEHEDVSEVEEEEEEEVEEVKRETDGTAKGASAELKRKPSTLPKNPEEEPKQLTEAEMAMLAAKKRHEEEEAVKILEYEERRRMEKEQIEEELKQLKEKQNDRKKQREEEYRLMAEKSQEEDKRRHEEETERKAKIEAMRRRKEEEKRKKHDLSVNCLGEVDGGGKNYMIDKNGPKGEVPSGQGKAKNAEAIAAEKAEAKKNYLAAISKQAADTSNMLPNDLKTRIKALHTRICKIEADKYDLEKRHEGLEYDLKELHERQLQVVRNKALKMGLEPEEVDASSHPPKVNVASKFDRQIDRRSYSDRRELYEHPFFKKQPKIAHGTARPPPEWGRRDIEELEILRKNADRPQYVEVVKAEGDAAKPPIDPIPLSLPGDDEDDVPQQPKTQKAPATAQKPPKAEKTS